MRVISGRLGGRRLHAPASQDTRPSSQRVRTALFDRLGARVLGARVLDLYAGSGALGIEALSRGAAHAVFVEHARAALAALRRNLAELGLSGCSRVLPDDVERAVERLCAEGARFELVLLDPPYQIGAQTGRGIAAHVGRSGAPARARLSRDASARDSAKFATVEKRARAELLRARMGRVAGEAGASASAPLSVRTPSSAGDTASSDAAPSDTTGCAGDTAGCAVDTAADCAGRDRRISGSAGPLDARLGRGLDSGAEEAQDLGAAGATPQRRSSRSPAAGKPRAEAADAPHPEPAHAAAVHADAQRAEPRRAQVQQTELQQTEVQRADARRDWPVDVHADLQADWELELADTAAPGGGAARSRRARAARPGPALWLPPEALTRLVLPDGWLVAERSRRDSAWTLPGWRLDESREHGETRLDCYQRCGESGSGAPRDPVERR